MWRSGDGWRQAAYRSPPQWRPDTSRPSCPHTCRHVPDAAFQIVQIL